jgi:GTP-binding protein Era
MQHRAGFCAIVGRPNVGKSTLLNRLLGEKVAIVTPKPQTTRNRILGIRTYRHVAGSPVDVDAQVVFLDTPGIHAGKGALNKYMVDQALAALDSVNVILYLVEASRPPERFVLERLKSERRPMVLVINKIDLVTSKDELLPRIESWAHEANFAEIIPISATQGDGVDRVARAVVARLPESPPLYPDDQLTDAPERFLAAELIREQVFLAAHDEVPYATAVTIESWQEQPGGNGQERAEVTIEGTIHVERESQKAILIGRGGRMIKEIGTRARAEIARMVDAQAHLRLSVRVDPEWSRSAATLKRLGYG